MATLIPDLTFYLQASLASSTSNTYRTAWTSYLSFCQSSCVIPLPLSQHVLQFYVTQLARTVSYQTIKVYLAGLQFHSNVMGYQIQLSNMQLLYYVLRGIRRVQGSNCHRPRRPAITMHHLRQLLQFISTSSLHHHDQKMLWSAVTLAFWFPSLFGIYFTFTFHLYYHFTIFRCFHFK